MMELLNLVSILEKEDDCLVRWRMEKVSSVHRRVDQAGSIRRRHKGAVSVRRRLGGAGSVGRPARGLSQLFDRRRGLSWFTDRQMGLTLTRLRHVVVVEDIRITTHHKRQATYSLIFIPLSLVFGVEPTPAELVFNDSIFKTRDIFHVSGFSFQICK